MFNLNSLRKSIFFLIFFQLVAVLHVQDAVFEQALSDDPQILPTIQDTTDDPALINTQNIISQDELEELTIAGVLNEENLYKYLAMNIEFFPEHKQARWVGYFISRERLEGEHFKRKGIPFTADKRIKNGSAQDEDYRKSGYDRGHLAPARDMAFSKETLQQSFLFSNISPQEPKFNRGKWSELEKFARDQALKRDYIIVITGPVFTDESIKTIGANNVTVPSLFFKALLFYSKKRVEAIGFVMPNEKLKEELDTYACSIDSMEEIVSIDVFPALPDEVEEVVEAGFNWHFWFGDDEEGQTEEYIEGADDDE